MNSSEKFRYIDSIACSDRGLVRRNNEDSYACLEQVGCFLVSDGMGGGEAGEIASQIVEECISDAVADSAEDSPGSRKYAVQQAIHRANRTIREYAQSHAYAQMGATLALFLPDSWRPDRAWLCHVGDSRIYRLRRGALQRLTRDHTLGTELADSTSNPAFADHASSPVSHLLTRSIGIAGKVLPEWQETECLPGDLFLLCSDGVSTMLTDSEIQHVLSTVADPGRMLALLSGRIRVAGARDNYTIILCRIASSLPEPEMHSEEERNENAYLLKIAEERVDHA